MIEFIGPFSALKKHGYKFERYTTDRCMTWTLYNPKNPYKEYIRFWSRGQTLEIGNYNHMSEVFAETIINEKLFETTRNLYRERWTYDFMINYKKPEFVEYIFDRHDQLYILSYSGHDMEWWREMDEIRLRETEGMEIVHLAHDSWFIENVRNLVKFGLIEVKP